LGHQVFVKKHFDEETILQALEAFKHFRALMDRHQVSGYRAVATSACRESENSHVLIDSIQSETGVLLEVIDASEEARLINEGVFQNVGPGVSPGLVMDLGGGSLEFNLIRGHEVQQSLTVPVGTVRIMEMLSIDGALTNRQVADVRQYVRSHLDAHLSRRPDLLGAEAVACGGNAEALCELAPGRPRGKIATMDMYLLEEILWRVLNLDVAGRMSTFDVSRDRAEVMGIAAVVFTTIGRWLRLSELMVPGVGVREGVIHDLVGRHFGPVEVNEGSRRRLTADFARRMALRLGCERGHIDQVKRLSLSIFDQLKPDPRLVPEGRFLLEVAALLHDIGHVVERRNHNRHGEYMVSQSRLPAMSSRQQNMVACIVRYHTKGKPRASHKLYGSLAPGDRKQVRLLSAILRISERLDSDHQQGVELLEVALSDGMVEFGVHGDLQSVHTLTDAEAKVGLFEDAFGREAVFAARS
jgi:exopolyphosphatase/guanosine-5'-triphosphate,3'-diphosphate pyrophosphatase